MPIQTLYSLVTFAGVPLDYVFSASGTVGFDTPYPTCSVLVPVKPATGNEGDELTVVCGGGNNVGRGTYRVMRFRGSDNPPTVEIVGAGSLARAEEVIPYSYYGDPLDDVTLYDLMGAQVFTASGSTLTTAAAHGWADGQPVVVATSRDVLPPGVLPSPLARWTVYYVVSASGSTLGLASTPGGSAISVSGGSGTTFVFKAPTGGEIVRTVLDQVAAVFPEVVYVATDVDDAGVLLGLIDDDAYLWRVGQSALDYIREIDRLEGYRTFQSTDGTIYRRLITGTPRNALDFTFNAGNTLPGASGDRNDEETRNWVQATGADIGGKHGPVTYTHTDSNDLQHIDEPHIARFSHQGIERENTADTGPGYAAQQIAEREIENVNKEFVRDSLSTADDTLFGPGQTHDIQLLTYIRVGEPMWCQSLTWRMDTQTGWTQTLSHTGGGLQTAYTPPPV